MEVEVEAPAGERRVYSEAGYYAQAVYTPEQQARLGIDEHGGPAPRGLSARQPAATLGFGLGLGLGLPAAGGDVRAATLG